MMKVMCRFVLAGMVLALGSGCSSSSASSSAMTTQPSGAQAKGTHLWTKTDEAVALPDTWAKVHGILTVNSKGCFGIGQDLLWAPADATIVDGGSGVDLPGVGTVHLGNTIETKGSVFKQSKTDAGVAEVKDCIPGDSVSVVSLYGSATPSS